MSEARNVLYFAENAPSAIQGGGIVAYAVLKGLSPERLLGFYEYRNITPVPEYADRCTYLGPWRTPSLEHQVNRLTLGRSTDALLRLFAERYIRLDFDFVRRKVEQSGFRPEVVYFSGLSYRYLRLATLAAEHWDLPIVQLNMDDWMEVERESAGRWGELWHGRIVQELTNASARGLVSTSNSPRLAAKLTKLTGYRHVAANNCCSDLLEFATRPARQTPNRIPIITYAGAMNVNLQGETLKVLASAVTELNAEGTRVHLHVYTPWEFAPAANAMAVPHAVFYKGQVSRERLADIFTQSDFLATTVTYRDRHISLFRHSLSTKLSEYLCVGKPVISMGHRDWHLHEYVQDNGCGYSILMDEHFSRAAIKAQLKRILATDRAVLDEIGQRNRQLWERAHDVEIMARDTRRALRLPVPEQPFAASLRRGVAFVTAVNADGSRGWLPIGRLKAICRRLVDVYHHEAVDLIGIGAFHHPELTELLTYCTDIGLQPAVVEDAQPHLASGRYEPAGARWSLLSEQRAADAIVPTPLSVFEQIDELRGTAPTVSTLLSTPVTRAINQLSIRIAEDAIRIPTLWVYGSAVVGLDVLQAIEQHRWLGRAVRLGGFLSSPGHCTADTLHGYSWKAVDRLNPQLVDYIVVTSETSRLAIQEELSRHGLLDRMVPIYGMRGMDCRYERVPEGPGQWFTEGFSDRDYAERELGARLAGALSPATIQEHVPEPLRRAG